MSATENDNKAQVSSQAKRRLMVTCFRQCISRNDRITRFQRHEMRVHQTFLL